MTDENVQQRGLAKYQLESLCLEMKNSKYEKFFSPEGWNQYQQTFDETLDWLRQNESTATLEDFTAQLSNIHQLSKPIKDKSRFLEEGSQSHGLFKKFEQQFQEYIQQNSQTIRHEAI